MRRVNNLVASILGRYAFLTADTPRRCSRILLDLTGSKSDFTIVEIADRGRLGEAHDSDISTTSLLQSLVHERKKNNLSEIYIGSISRDESTAVREGVGVATPRIVELFTTTVKARGVFAVGAFYTKHRDRIDFSSGRPDRNRGIRRY